MKKKIYISLGFIIAFIAWTVAVCLVDVQPIGPRESSVGFATINGFIHNTIGVNMTLYNITDWLGLIPIAIMLGFAIMGIVQWIKRRKLSKVDYSLFILAGFYFVVLLAYLLFEFVVINRRPVLIEGILEASYPSSTTMLVLCIMPTALMQLNVRIKNTTLKKWLSVVIIAFIVFMVVGRLVSGVHWFSDIFGGALLSIGLVIMYDAVVKIKS